LAALARSAARHWPEYLMEAAGLGGFMISACVFTILLFHPASPLEAWLPDGLLRRMLMGCAMGLTAIGIIHSPWGKQSGAHLNPAVTLTFLALGRVHWTDALGYMLAQTLGGLAGVLLVAAMAGPALAAPEVWYAVTVPGPGGPPVAWATEFALAGLLMLVVLTMSAHPATARWTGCAAGVLVALFITFAAPLSGMSMNPARTLASAIPSGTWTAVWVYFTAPPAAMLGVAGLYAVVQGSRDGDCAKLHHVNRKRCIFCLRRAANPRRSAVRGV
jgi:aquaporin Z